MPHPSSNQKDTREWARRRHWQAIPASARLTKPCDTRGYAVSDLVQCSFEEIAHLLLWGDLPTATSARSFYWADPICCAVNTPNRCLLLSRDSPRRAPQTSIMDVLRTGVSLLGQLECDNGPKESPHDSHDLSQERTEG